MNRVGRGGAGNYKPAQNAQSVEQPDQDLELGRTVSNTNTNNDNVEGVSSKEEPIVKTGRGGAGNWSTPEDLVRTQFETSIKTIGKAPKTEMPPSHRGRGGAGNYTGHVDQTAEEKAKAAQRAQQEKINQDATQHVDAALVMPPQAHVNSRKNEFD